VIDLSGRLASGDTLYGTFLGLGSALAAEACALAGFDWLLTDLEHGGGDESELLHQQTAADAHAARCSSGSNPPTASAPGTPSTWAQPGSCSPESNQRTRPPRPSGTSATPRTGTAASPPINRSYGFGLHPERLETANERVLGIVQIESRQAVERVEEITKVPGIHVLFIGPRDLSHDLGVPGDTSAPAFQDALQRVLAAAEEAGLAAGILAPDAETARRYADQGLRFIGIGSDATLLALAGKHALDCVNGTRRT
jgi:2-keto-3-deoxy-L-rhamnonate aldolase RhmA